MSVKKIIVLVVLLVIVGGWYFIDKSRVEKAKQQEEESKQIFAFGPDDVVRVKLEREAEVMVAEREDKDRWKILEPYEAAGDKDAFRGLVRDIGNGRIQQPVEDPGELKNYGLEDPKVKVTFTVREASAEHTLLFGDKIPSGPDYYAKREADPAVFTVYSNIFRNADKGLFDFTDRSLLDFEVTDVKSYEVLGRDTMLAFDLSNNKDVKILQPYQLPAKGTDVQSLLWKVKSGKVAEFGPRKVPQSELGKYGLIEPATKVVLGFGTEGSDRSYKALLIGDATEDEGKQRYWAMRERGSDVFLLEAQTVKDIYKNPDQLRYDKIGKIRDWEAKSIELQRPGETITLTKEETQWKMTAPREVPGNSDGIRSFLDKFAGYSGYKVKDYIMGATDLVRYHLADPPYRVTVKSDQLEETYTLSDMMIEQDEEGETIRRVYAQWSGYPDVVLVMEETQPIIDMLNSALDEFGVFPTPTPAPTSPPPPTQPPEPEEAIPEEGEGVEKVETGSAAKPSATEDVSHQPGDE